MINITDAYARGTTDYANRLKFSDLQVGDKVLVFETGFHDSEDNIHQCEIEKVSTKQVKYKKLGYNYANVANSIGNNYFYRSKEDYYKDMLTKVRSKVGYLKQEIDRARKEASELVALLNLPDTEISETLKPLIYEG